MNSQTLVIRSSGKTIRISSDKLILQMCACHHAGTTFAIAWQAISAVRPDIGKAINEEQARTLWELLRPEAYGGHEIDVARELGLKIEISRIGVAKTTLGQYQMEYRAGDGWTIPTESTAQYRTLIDLFTDIPET